MTILLYMKRALASSDRGWGDEREHVSARPVVVVARDWLWG